MVQVPAWNPEFPECPFDDKGNLLHYPTYQANSWAILWPFESVMTITAMHRGRSAAYFTVTDEAGKQYTLFMSDLMDILKDKSVVQGKTPRLRWVATKKGTNYGIKWRDI